MAYVAESLIVSQNGKLVALIYPDWEQVDKQGIDHNKIEILMQENIKDLNELLPGYSKISGIKCTYKNSKRRLKEVSSDTFTSWLENN